MKKAFEIISILILILSVLLAIVWVVNPQKFNFEPVIGLLGLLYVVIPIIGTYLIRKLGKAVNKERLTLSYALAYGYFNNYLAPVVRHLRKEAADPDKLKFFVYIPRYLEELKRDSINGIITELENQKYEVKAVELDFEDERRKKDFRTAKKLKGRGQQLKYFDFPTTLLTLEKAVDFKLETKSGDSPEAQKRKLADEYISEFRTHLEQMLASPLNENIRSNIKIVEGGINFLDASESK